MKLRWGHNFQKKIVQYNLTRVPAVFELGVSMFQHTVIKSISHRMLRTPILMT